MAGISRHGLLLFLVLVAVYTCESDGVEKVIEYTLIVQLSNISIPEVSLLDVTTGFFFLTKLSGNRWNSECGVHLHFDNDSRTQFHW